MLTDKEYSFTWKDIGDIELGRPNLSNSTQVAVYRLMQYTMRSVLIKEFGVEAAKKIFYDAGKLAGKEFCLNLLDCSLDFYAFVAELQLKLEELGIGILRFEKTDLENMLFTLTVQEDLDCSGLPMTDETVCDYDEGFFSGILEKYTSHQFDVRETDCWSNGARVCRFIVTPRK